MFLFFSSLFRFDITQIASWIFNVKIQSSWQFWLCDVQITKVFDVWYGEKQKEKKTLVMVLDWCTENGNLLENIDLTVATNLFVVIQKLFNFANTSGKNDPRVIITSFFNFRLVEAIISFSACQSKHNFLKNFIHCHTYNGLKLSTKRFMLIYYIYIRYDARLLGESLFSLEMNIKK